MIYVKSKIKILTIKEESKRRKYSLKHMYIKLQSSEAKKIKSWSPGGMLIKLHRELVEVLVRKWTCVFCSDF